jgi:hypothetical protein
LISSSVETPDSPSFLNAEDIDLIEMLFLCELSFPFFSVCFLFISFRRRLELCAIFWVIFWFDTLLIFVGFFVFFLISGLLFFADGFVLVPAACYS